jgi:hypothetical protein
VLRALSRPYSGSLRQAENITEMIPPERRPESTRRAPLVVVCLLGARGEFLLLSSWIVGQSDEVITEGIDHPARALLEYWSVVQLSMEVLH